MKSISANTQNLLNINTGTEPYVFIKIEWSSGTIYYGDKETIIGSTNIYGNILSISEISNLKKADSASEISTCSVQLCDKDGSLKTFLNTLIIQGTKCTIYQYFNELTSIDDATILLTGKILEDVTWNEGQRIFDFTVETAYEDEEVGYVIEEGFIDNLNPDVIGENIPLCFGTPIYVPAVKVRKIPEGSLKEDVDETATYLLIDGGEYFPQDEEIQIDVDKVRYTGYFDGEKFYITSSNDNHYTNITPAERPAESLESDTDYTTILWVEEGVNLEGLYVVVYKEIYLDTYIYMVNRCTLQEGTKCTFIQPWMPNYTVQDNIDLVINTTEYKFKVDDNDIILYAAGRPRADWPEEYIYYKNYAVTVKNSNSGISLDYDDDNKITNITILRYSRYISGQFSIESGVDAYLVASYSTLFVCNMIPSTYIYEVMAYREVEGEKKLVAIPSSYYIKSLSNTLGSLNCTTIEFPNLLRECEGWYLDDIYVTLESSIGPNVLDILKWIVLNYTDLTIDYTSFNEVKIKLENYPANFALFVSKNALTLCEEIAWQARCAIIIIGETIYLKYLSEVPNSDFTITNSKILNKTLLLGHTGLDSIVTRLTGTWVPDYISEDKKIIYTNNIDNFGLTESNKDMYIYSDEDLVKLSIYFWGYRLSNSWRTTNFETFLNTLALTTFDCITHNLTILSTNTIKGDIEEVTQDTSNNTFNISCILASKAGDISGTQPIEDLYYYYGDPNFPVIESENPITVEDPSEGRQETDYTIDCDEDIESEEEEEDSYDSEDTDTLTYSIVITAIPGVVERDTYFELAAQIQDNLGNLANINFNTFIIGNYTDVNDIDNLNNIQFIGGKWLIDAAQITGGDGVDVGNTITIAGGNNITAATSIQFTIIDEQTDEMTIEGPYSVTRDENFSINISNGPLATDLRVQFNGTDNRDALFSGGAAVNTITTDGAGSWSTNAWYITGGSDEKFGNITFIDTNMIFKDGKTGVFPIDGDSLHQLKIVEYESNITRDVPFDMKFELQTQGGKHINGNGTVYIYIQETTTDGDDITPDTVEMINGWAYLAAEIDGGSGSDTLTITAEMVGAKSDSVIVSINEPQIVVIECPGTIIRTYHHNLVVEIRDNNNQLLKIDTTLNIAINSGDGSDVVSPTTIDIFDGIGEVPTFTVEGGSGEDDTIFEISGSGYTSVLTDTVLVIDSLSYTYFVYTKSLASHSYGGDASLYNTLATTLKTYYPVSVAGQTHFDVEQDDNYHRVANNAAVHPQYYYDGGGGGAYTQQIQIATLKIPYLSCLQDLILDANMSNYVTKVDPTFEYPPTFILNIYYKHTNDNTDTPENYTIGTMLNWNKLGNLENSTIQVNGSQVFQRKQISLKSLINNNYTNLLLLFADNNITNGFSLDLWGASNGISYEIYETGGSEDDSIYLYMKAKDKYL